MHIVGFHLIGTSSYNWYVIFRSCTSQQTKTSLCETYTTPSSSSFVYVLWTQIHPIWLLYALPPASNMCGQTYTTARTILSKNGGNKILSKMSSSNATWLFKTGHDTQRLTYIINKLHYKNPLNCISNSSLLSISSFLSYEIIVIFIMIDVFYHNPF